MWPLLGYRRMIEVGGNRAGEEDEGVLGGGKQEVEDMQITRFVRIRLLCESEACRCGCWIEQQEGRSGIGIPIMRPQETRARASFRARMANKDTTSSKCKHASGPDRAVIALRDGSRV